MQDYTPLGSTATTTVKDGILNHEKNINALRSTYSGTAFPTENLVAGLKCYRTDLGKTYTYNGETWDDSVTTTSLTVSGETNVPTPSTENNSKTIANTEFVHGVVSNLVNGAPDALNTLQELATALGNDPNFSTTILNKIGEKESKTDAQIEHEKLQNAIDSSLKNKAALGSSANPNQVITIPMEKGMYLLAGYPDGFTTLDDKYPYALIVNFKSNYGGILSLYIQDKKRDIYYRTGWEDVWRTGWTKLATTDEIPTKVSQLSNDSGYQKTAEIPVASQTQNGYMSKDDKAKLDGIVDMFYPVGTVYMSADKSKTKADFPFMQHGTWEEVPANLCMQTGNASEAGTQRSAGLPDISGHLVQIMWEDIAVNNGAYTFAKENFKPFVFAQDETNASKWFSHHVYFNASTSNPIYGSSDTVQPPAYIVRAWVRTA